MRMTKTLPCAAPLGMAALALTVNVLLLLLIHALLQHPAVRPTERRVLEFVDFIRLKPATDIAPPARHAPPPPPPTTAPVPPLPEPVRAAQTAPSAGRALAIEMPELQAPAHPMVPPALGAAPSGEPGTGTAAVGNGSGDGNGTGMTRAQADEIEVDLVPTYKQAPAYPVRALRAGLEGVVTVEFMIDTDGRVHAPTIVSADPPGVFDQAVLDALPNWRFSPRHMDGRAVERRARQDIRFTLQRR
jgi:protein TonB